MFTRILATIHIVDHTYNDQQFMYRLYEFTTPIKTEDEVKRIVHSEVSKTLNISPNTLFTNNIHITNLENKKNYIII